jgi:hypothetical protein
MLRVTVAFLIGVLALLPLGIGPSWAAGPRIALVIGNSTYQHAPELVNPANDARDMSDALKALGFEVIVGLNLDKVQLDRTILNFAERLVGAEVGAFFYAGHGIQVSGQNYLVPIDAKLTAVAALDFELTRLDLVQRTMERQTKTNIIFLDACRNNPLARNLARALGTRSMDIGRGLAPMESGVGTLISFSTQPGNVALDGSGRTSPFAQALLNHIRRPGEDLSSVLIRVRNDVMAATRDQQVPWEHSALRAKFYFADPDRPPTTPAVAMPAPQKEGKSGAFDGVWDVWITKTQNCKIKSARFLTRIVNSQVMNAYPDVGTVDMSGNIRWSHRSPPAPHRLVHYEGRLSKSTGKATFRVDEVPCTGEVAIRRVEPGMMPDNRPGQQSATASLEPNIGGVEQKKTGPFDGLWEVTLTSTRQCPFRTSNYRTRIENNEILFGYPKLGTVNPSGKFKYTHPAKLNPKLMVHNEGTLSGGSGRGQFYSARGPCSGEVSLKRVGP